MKLNNSIIDIYNELFKCFQHIQYYHKHTIHLGKYMFYNHSANICGIEWCTRDVYLNKKKRIKITKQFN